MVCLLLSHFQIRKPDLAHKIIFGIRQRRITIVIRQHVQTLAIAFLRDHAFIHVVFEQLREAEVGIQQRLNPQAGFESCLSGYG
jgi:hypothetical protein